jgi:hypothetical protein
MASLERRLEHLESARRRDETQLRREALTYLSDENLHALEEVLVAREEDPSASSEDLYRLVGERGRRAVVALNESLQALKEGRGPKRGATQ